MICGLQKPTGGDFSIYGISHNDRKIALSRRRMGAVVETPAVYPDMTAEENLKQQYLTLGLPGFDGIPELLKLVGLEGTGRKKTKDFSLGMRQRLGIAVAHLVVQDPVVLPDSGIGRKNKLVHRLLGNLLLVGLDRQIVLALMDGNRTDSEHVVQKPGKKMLSRMHDHEEIAVVPVKDQLKILAFLHRCGRRKDKDGLPVIALSCVQNPVRAKRSPVSRLSAAFGVEDRTVGDDLGGFVRMVHARDCAREAASVWLGVIILVHDSIVLFMGEVV